MIMVTGLLTLQESNRPSGGLLMVANIARLGETPQTDPIFEIQTELDRQRWTGIVIHHSGEPAGDLESMNRLHLSMGYKGLGYHFLIGNGNGLGDGVIQMGYRWSDQLPGAHVAGPSGQLHNQASIGICLIGNGDRRPFTESQMSSLTNLIQRLQRELRIPPEQVYLHRELASGIASPGRFFSTSQLQEQLIDLTY